jgi:hypothetical protein
MLRAFAEAASVHDRTDYLDIAVRNAEFVIAPRDAPAREVGHEGAVLELHLGGAGRLSERHGRPGLCSQRPIRFRGRDVVSRLRQA